MQRQPLQRDLVAKVAVGGPIAVVHVPDDGVRQLFQMASQLMHTPRQRLSRDQCRAVALLQTPEPGVRSRALVALAAAVKAVGRVRRFSDSE